MIARDLGGRAIAAEALQWSSSDAGVASVDPVGMVMGIAAGQVEIRVEAGDAADTAQVTALPFISLGPAEPRAINGAGTVAGSIGGQPFVWSRAAGVRRLPSLSGTATGGVGGLADNGTAVGISGEASFDSGEPVIWTFTPEGAVSIERLPWTGGPTGFANGVSRAGDRIVGTVFTRPKPDQYNPYPALWTCGADGAWSIELLPVPPDAFGGAFNLNEAGLILGLIEADGPQGLTSSVVVWLQRPDLAWTFETIATGELGTVSGAASTPPAM